MPLTIAARLDRARHSHATLVRFSARREAFLEALDWEAFDPGFVRETSMADEQLDRKSVVSGKSVSVRVALGGCRIIKKNNAQKISYIYHQSHITTQENT